MNTTVDGAKGDTARKQLISHQTSLQDIESLASVIQYSNICSDMLNKPRETGM